MVDKLNNYRLFPATNNVSSSDGSFKWEDFVTVNALLSVLPHTKRDIMVHYFSKWRREKSLTVSAALTKDKEKISFLGDFFNFIVSFFTKTALWPDLFDFIHYLVLDHLVAVLFLFQKTAMVKEEAKKNVVGTKYSKASAYKINVFYLWIWEFSSDYSCTITIYNCCIDDL